MNTADYSQLHGAVALLAGVCDFASSRDNVGFNGTDAPLGHALADMGAAAWDEPMALAAWDMIRKYRHTQLKAAGIDYDALPVPPGAEALADERRHDAREHARAKVREHRERQYRRARSFVICDGEDEEVLLGFPFDWALVGEAKAIAGRRYKEEHKGFKKINWYPFSALPAVIAFADKHDIPVTPEVRVLVDIAQARHAVALAAAEKATAERASQPHVRLGERGGLIIDKDRDGDTQQLNLALRALNRDRSTWDREAGLHRPPLRDPEALKKIIADFGLTVSPEAQELLDTERQRQQATLEASQAATAEPMAVRGLDESVTIKPQQWPAIRWALQHRRTWIGDDMGLGKSLSALAAVAVDDAYPLVIVCLPNLALNWVNELARFPGLNVFVAEGQKPQPIPRGTDVVVIGTAALGYAPAAGNATRSYPWVTAISAIRPRGLILDEGQIAKESTANRTKALKALAAPIVERDGMVLNLTGTALMNRPKELLSQLEIMGRADEFGGAGAFLMRYCVSEQNQWGTKFNGAHHLDELFHILRTRGIMVRRNKDILGLPVCHEPIEYVTPGLLDAELMNQYRAAERDVVTFLSERAAKLAKRFGVDPDDARVRAAMKAQAAEHLVMINTLRGLIGQAKVGYAARWVAERVADGEKVMIAAHHKEVTAPLAKAFGGLRIVGEQSTKSKEADKARFQNDPGAMVITVAVEAGGMGHTLTAARLGLMVELTWTPGARNQMRDRINRIGQTREMTFTTLLARGTIDEYMFGVVASKQAVLQAVLDGKAAEGVEDSAESMAADVAWQMAMSGLKGYGGRA